MNFISRFGLIGEKLGMTTVLKNNKISAVTLVKISTQNLIEKKNLEDYSIIKVGVEGFGKLKKKPQIKEMQKLQKPLCKVVKEFRVNKEEADNCSEQYGVEVLKDELFVDVTSKSIGKGFAGGMKRWNFSGAGASHGTSLTHRAIGSTGTRDKNWPNKKMPGRLGHETVTTQNIRIHSIDTEMGIIALNGSVSGKPGTMVLIRKAIKKAGNKK